jgi:hypothetical protein
VQGRRRPHREHAVTRALRDLTGVLEEPVPAKGGKLSWQLEYSWQGRALSVPVVFLDEGTKKRKGRREDLVVELLLDCDRDGVHVALVALLDPSRKRRFPLRVATSYREARRTALEGVLQPLIAEGFQYVPASQFLRAGDERYTNGVALAARFIPRAELRTDDEVLAALRLAGAASERARKRGLARPDRGALHGPPLRSALDVTSP